MHLREKYKNLLVDDLTHRLNIPVRALAIKTGKSYNVYALATGRHSPVATFLDEVAQKHSNEFGKLVKLIDYSAEMGPPVNKQKVNNLGNGIYEFKTTGGLRLLWFYDAGKMILCTHGFVKKRQTTPRKEIQYAVKIKTAYDKAKAANQVSFPPTP